MPGDPQSVVLRFLNEDGVDLDEAAQRRIERLYDREESRRVLAAEIGDIGFASRTLEFYTNELTNLVDLDAIRAARFKLVLDYAFGTTSFVMPNVLAKLGADVLGINPNVSTAGVIGLRQGRARGPARRARAGPRAPTSGAMLDPDGEQLTLVDDTGHVLDDDEALLALSLLVASAEPDKRDRRAGGREQAGRGDLRRHGRRGAPDQALGQPAARGGRLATGRLRREHLGGFRLPAVPAGLRRRRHLRAPPLACSPPATSRSRASWPAFPRPTSSGGRFRPRSSKRASSCGLSSSGRTQPSSSCSTG